MANFLIRNANVFDGSGADGQVLDVAVRDGRICRDRAIAEPSFSGIH